MSPLEAAARELLRAEDALRDARNGGGHEGPHNRDLFFQQPGDVQIYDMVDDCSACGGAEYGCDDEVARASVALRVILDIPLRPWEQYYVDSGLVSA